MGHQGPCSLPGPRVIAVEDADVEQVLGNNVKHRNKIAYDFVDVDQATGWMDIWVKGYDLLEV